MAAMTSGENRQYIYIDLYNVFLFTKKYKGNAEEINLYY